MQWILVLHLMLTIHISYSQPPLMLCLTTMPLVTGHAVPEIMLNLLQGKPTVKEWLTIRLGVIDMP